MSFDNRSEPYTPPAVPAALSRMEVAQLVRRLEESDPTTGSLLYLFKHTLVQETAYTAMMRHDRKRLHKMVAEELERAYPNAASELAPRLAAHFEEAGETERALYYYARAARDAAAQYANREALAFYAHALGAAHELDSPTLDALYRARGEIYERIGEFEAARADFENAVQIARARHDAAAEWQGLLDLGFAWLASDYAHAGEYFEKALELARASNDAARVAYTLNRVGNWYMNNEDADRALSYHREALSIFEGLNDTRGLAETQDLLGMSSLMSSDFYAGIQHFQSALELYQALGDRHGVAAALISLRLQNVSLQSDSLVLPPVVATPDESMTQLLPLVQELGWRAGECFVLWSVGEGFAAIGEYGRALEIEEQAMALAREIGHRQWLAAATMLYGAVHADLMEFEVSERELEHAVALAREIASLHWTRNAAGFLATTYIAQSKLDQAQRTLDAFAPEGLSRRTLGQRQMWKARVELALARGEPEQALEMLELLQADAPNITTGIVIPRLSVLRAQILLKLKRFEEAKARLDEAQAYLESRQQPRLMWRAQAVLAQVYRAQGRAAEAERAANTAREIISTLAGSLPQGALRENFVRRAEKMIGEGWAP